MNGPYFIVHSAEVSEGAGIVDGRLEDFPLKVGHVFGRTFPDSHAWRVRENGVPCAVVVREIEAYHHKLEELSPGMTARLYVSGSHLGVVKPGVVIE